MMPSDLTDKEKPNFTHYDELPYSSEPPYYSPNKGTYMMGANTIYYARVPRPREWRWVEISAVTADEAMAEAHVQYGECVEVVHYRLYDHLKAVGEI